MRNRNRVDEWLKRAKSNLERAQAGKVSQGILYEDLCFDCQQAVEKSLKGLLVYIGVSFPWTHSIAKLVELAEETGMDIPEYVKDSIILTVYAVSTRYPGDQEAVDEGEYKEAVEIAEKIYHWVETKLEGQ
jgi:HEPN domain-containing protein